MSIIKQYTEEREECQQCHKALEPYEARHICPGCKKHTCLYHTLAPMGLLPRKELNDAAKVVEERLKEMDVGGATRWAHISTIWGCQPEYMLQR